MKDEVVYVRWYKEVVEGKVVNEHDLFGMVAVRIPIQGVYAVALFTPKDIYKTAQEACGTFPKHFPTPKEIVHLDLATSVADSISPEYNTLQQFKHDHWNHERNMLELDYWEEYDRMFHAYARKRFEMMRPQQNEKSMEIEKPTTPEECFEKIIIPSSGYPKPDAYNNFWIDALKEQRIETAKEESQDVKPRIIGKPISVTELSIF